MEKILITGSAGFIGMHLCKYLLNDGYDVLGIDNINNYYNSILKKNRLKVLRGYDNFEFIKADISDLRNLESIFNTYEPNKVVNLAAQAGVRYSLKNPHAYIQSNIVGFMNIAECCRKYAVNGLIYASSSSVYGLNDDIPFKVIDRVDKPISIYAVSKKTNEHIAHAYNHLYDLRSTGLRFFSVYGPWGRPDMAIYIFTDKIQKGQTINVFNHGNMYRDFTYIDDIIQGTVASIENNYKYELFNLGNNRCENIMELIELIEENLKIKAKIKFMDIQPGDVEKTFADIKYSKDMLGYEPHTSIHEGIPKFIDWYKSYII